MTHMLRLLLTATVFTAALSAHAAPLDTVAINLDPLIDVAAKEKNRFAVDVPHAVRLDRGGTPTESSAAPDLRRRAVPSRSLSKTMRRM